MNWTQALLASLSLTALALQLSGRPRAERFAPLFGLAAQPFWYLAASGWGMRIVVAAYACLWARRLWMNEKHRWRTI